MDQVEEVKQKIDMVKLVEGYVSLKQAGRNFKGLCPFHQEKTPSFMVNPELGVFKCFGCSKGGDCFNFIEEIEGLDFSEALSFLAERAGVKLIPRGDGSDRSELDLLRQAHEMAALYYHYLLTKHPVGQEARDYLKDRGIGQKLINQFQLGFAINSWDGLKSYLVEKKQIKLELLERAGLLVKSPTNYYDRFRGRVMFPLRDHKGKVVGFAGRILPIYSTDKDAKYINSPETPLYHKSLVLYGLFEAKNEIRHKDRAVLVEGELDMISSFAAGVSETVAIKGTALTEDQIKLLSRFTNNLILALDADSAGETAAKRSIALAEAAGMNVKIIQLVEAKDPDEIARRDPKLWKKLVDKAIDIYQFYLDSALKKHDPTTVEGKRKITAEILPIWSKISNQVVRSHYVKKLAQILGVSEESVGAEIDRISRGQELVIETKPTITLSDPEDSLGRELLRLLWETQDSNQVAKQLAGLPLQKATGKLILHWLDYSSPLIGEAKVLAFIKSLPAELKALAGEIYLEPVDPGRLGRDLDTTIDQLENYLVKQKLNQLTQLIREEKDVEEKKRLLRLHSQWSRRRA